MVSISQTSLSSEVGKMKQKGARIKFSHAAKRLGITPRTLKRWSEDPAVGIPAAVLVKGRKYLYLDELLAWEAKNIGFGKEKK